MKINSDRQQIDPVNKIEDLLEIILLTYNRSSFLVSTLKQLQDSPFAPCRITVLDNCSTDDTRDVCLKASELFANLHIVTHRVNIGGNANYLRAVEISESLYTWVLCDDDTLHFSDCDDLLQTLATGSFDLLEVGSTARQAWEAGSATTTQEALKRGSQYFLGLSFMPAVIFKTALFDADCIAVGYNLIQSWYPHFALLNKALKINSPIYFAKNPLVVRNNVNESTFSPLSWYANWVSSCSCIENPAFRKEAIRQSTQLRGYFKSLAFWIAIEKHHDPSRFWNKITTIFLGYCYWWRPLLILFLPVMLVPIPYNLLVWARDLVYRFMQVPKEEVPPLMINDRNSG